jgi:endonuclease YncB( thermonuclease family)
MRWFFKVASVVSPVAFALVAPQVASAAAPAATFPPLAQSPGVPSFQGSARALDGDTLDVTTSNGTIRVRLEGIDAPEGGQRCNLRWLGTWDCGKAASLALAQLVRDRVVTCDNRGLDKYGRTLAVCFVDGRDVNAEMVRAGLAWAFIKYSTLYTAQESAAKTARLGVWQASTMTPWDWRAQQKLSALSTQRAPPQAAMGSPLEPRAEASITPPPGCDIKGSVSKNGRIYHTTSSPWYGRIRMDLGQGRRWFCSEAEAQDAGWRAAGTTTTP